MYYAATWAAFKPKLEKNKKIYPEKNSYISGNRTFLPQKKLNKNFLKFLAAKNLIKLFYTLDKTPLGETGYLGNLYYLLATQPSGVSIHFL